MLWNRIPEFNYDMKLRSDITLSRYGLLIQNRTMDLDYAIHITWLFGSRLRKSIMELHYGITLQMLIHKLYYGRILRNYITEL